MVDAGGCLAVRAIETDTLYVPVFPAEADQPLLLREGDRVVLRGGVLDDPPRDAVIPDRCPQEGPFWLVVADEG